MENAKISIVVPAYNIESYLPRCLDSILAQTYENLEVIVVNDGSTDGTGVVLDNYAQQDKRIRVIHKENSGVTKARFMGIRQATGEWIGFVDGDDYIEPDMYERLMKNAITYNADISHCGYQMVFPERVDYYYNTGCLEQQDNFTGLKELLQGTKIEPGLWNKLFHKKVFQKLLDSDVEDSGIKINEDLLMNFYLFQLSETSIYKDFCPYHYMIRKGSAATGKKPQHYLDSLKVLELLHMEVKENEELNSIVYSRYIYSLISASMQNDYKDISEKYHKELKNNCKQGLKDITLKLRIMAIMVAYFRPVYKLIRKVYELVTNVNHKYDVG